MAIDIFAVEPHIVSKDLRGYIVEIYGEPKTGKTTLATRFPQHLILAFEKGYNALPGAMAAPMNSWSEFISVLGQLKKPEAKQKYANIIIDTVDIAYDMCEKFICQREGKSKIGDIPYGGGYAMVEKEFDERLRSIVQLDFGLILISHAEEKNIKDELGEETTKIGPTVNKRATKIINRMADIIGYVRPITQKDPTTGEEHSKTYMFMRGSSRYVAGARFKYIVDCIDFSYDNLVKAMHDAIDKEALETNGQFLQEKRNNLYVETSSTKTFEQVMEDFTSLTEKIMDRGIPHPEIVKVIESILGPGKMVKDCTVDQQSLVELINQGLQDLLDSAAQ